MWTGQLTIEKVKVALRRVRPTLQDRQLARHNHLNAGLVWNVLAGKV